MLLLAQSLPRFMVKHSFKQTHVHVFTKIHIKIFNIIPYKADTDSISDFPRIPPRNHRKPTSPLPPSPSSPAGPLQGRPANEERWSWWRAPDLAMKRIGTCLVYLRAGHYLRHLFCYLFMWQKWTYCNDTIYDKQNHLSLSRLLFVSLTKIN